MKLADAELQQVTGCPVGRGTLSIRSQPGEPLHIASHERVLAASVTGGAGTTFWPLVSLARDSDGFCRVQPAEWGVHFRSLDVRRLGSPLQPVDKPNAFSTSGSVVGSLVRLGELPQNMDTVTWPHQSVAGIHSCEVTTLYGVEGLNVRISGRFDDAPSFPTLNNAEFVIDVTMSWETMILRGFGGAHLGWKFGQSALRDKDASPIRPRDPRKIHDVLVNEGLASPIVEGHLVFSPNTPSWRETKDKFVTANFSDAGPSAFLSDHDSMSISEAPGVEILLNGFARSMGGSRWLNIGLVGRGFLERELRRRDRLSLALSGDAVGSIWYSTGYGDEPGDPLGQINQAIRTMSIQASLSREGLQFAAQGECDDFDPHVIAEHRQKRGSKLRPVSRYSAEVMLPWSLLVCRGFSLAHRMKDF